MKFDTLYIHRCSQRTLCDLANCRTLLCMHTTCVERFVDLHAAHGTPPTLRGNADAQSSMDACLS